MRLRFYPDTCLHVLMHAHVHDLLTQTAVLMQPRDYSKLVACGFHSNRQSLPPLDPILAGTRVMADCLFNGFKMNFAGVHIRTHMHICAHACLDVVLQHALI